MDLSWQLTFSWKGHIDIPMHLHVHLKNIKKSFLWGLLKADVSYLAQTLNQVRIWKYINVMVIGIPLDLWFNITWIHIFKRLLLEKYQKFISMRTIEGWCIIFGRYFIKQKYGNMSMSKLLVPCDQEVVGPGFLSGSILSFRLIMKYFLQSFSPHSLPSIDSRREVVSYLQKNVHWVLVNHLVGLSLPRKSVVRFIDWPDMTIAV